VTQAARELFGNIPAGSPPPPGWALQHAIFYTLLWSVLILVIFVPLAGRQYRRAASR